MYNEYDNACYLGNDNDPYLLLIKAKDTSITTCEVHEKTKFIHSRAFQQCTSLNRVNICENIVNIGGWAFDGCTSLQFTTYDQAYYLGNDNNPYLVLVKALHTYISNCVINENTKVIAGHAFYSCSNLKSINIPTNVTDISDYAFSNCGALEIVTISEGVKRIGEGGFNDCMNLAKIVIPNSVLIIGDGAFHGCYNRESAMRIHCRVSSKPDGWDEEWNSSRCPIVWGYTGE